MRLMSSVSLMALLGALTGCDLNPQTQTNYRPSAVEAPQPVHFYYGTLIDRRPATLAYGSTAGIGAAFFPTSPYLAGLAVAGNGGTAGIGAAFGGVAVLAAGTIPSLPATEFTVCLNGGTYPPDPSYINPGPSAVIVVQNDYPSSYDIPDRSPNDLDLQPGTPVMVRVVGTAGRVMRVNPWLVQFPPSKVPPYPPRNGQCVAADRPMPVPLNYQPPIYGGNGGGGWIVQKQGEYADSDDYYPP
jgi:outer membrane lipoprotein SlyB